MSQDYRNNKRPSNNRNNYNILPSAQILESYEETAPGSVDKLLEMAAKEQEHRHDWQSRYLSKYNFTYRTGQLFSLIFGSSLIYLIFELVRAGEKQFALTIFATSAVLVFAAIFTTKRERTVGVSRPVRRSAPANNNNNRNRNRESGNRR